MISASVVTLFASAALVAGHGLVERVNIGGKEYPGTKNWDAPENKNSPVRGLPLDTGFVNFNNVNNPDIACSSSGYTPRTVTPEAAAGSAMGVRWGGDGGPDGKQWPHPEGPIIVYMASCNGKCSEFNPANAQFFKIHQEGLDTSKRPNAAGNDHTPAGDGLWAQNRIQYENSWSWFNIPADIKAGEYLVRHELISLHGAHTEAEGAQYYPSCIQVKVTGGGNATPATTPATQLYTRKDGLVDVWSPFPAGIKSYTIPGPAVYKAGSGGSSNPAPATTSSAAPSSTKPAANNNSNPTTAAPQPATTTKAGSKSCKAKRAARRSVADESRALYDRAYVAAAARHAHGLKRSTH